MADRPGKAFAKVLRDLETSQEPAASYALLTSPGSSIVLFGKLG